MTRRKKTTTAFVYGGLLVATIGVTLLAITPYFEKTEWTVIDPPVVSLTPTELKSDVWQWNQSSDSELMAIAKAEYERKNLLWPGFLPAEWGYVIYYKIRVLNSDLLQKIAHASDTDMTLWEPPAQKQFVAPVPSWWKPIYSVTLHINEERKAFFIDGSDPDIVYTFKEYRP